MEEKTQPQAPKKQRRGLGRVVAAISVVMAALVVLGTITLMVVVQITPLPSVTQPLASTVFDANGKAMDNFYLENRLYVNLSDVAPLFSQAVIAVEDRRFYQHRGVDFVGIIRALAADVLHRNVVQGASTITQQLARNLYLSMETTVTRKVKEAILALKLEQVYTKEEILGMYINEVNFGHGIYGVETASQSYFGKPAKDLDLAQAALLAGLPQNPEGYYPVNHLDRALVRQKAVLKAMVDAKTITPADADKAAAEKIEILPPHRFRSGGYVRDVIASELAGQLGNVDELLYQGGLQIFTTLDGTMQQAAESAIANMPTLGDPVDGVTQPQAALVAVDPATGGIRALVGGRSYQETQLNRATNILRSPGSSFKPFMYAAALETGRYSPATTVVCEPVTFNIAGQPPYQPKDYGGSYHYRPVTIREAIKISDNIVAVKTNADVGAATVVAMAHRLGVSAALHPGPSLPLGPAGVPPVQMAAAYAPFVNGGRKVTPYVVTEVRTPSGLTIWSQGPKLTPGVLDPKIGFILTSMMQSVLEPGGTGATAGAQIDRPAAGKTGTSDLERDAWFVGYTPDVVAAIYVGRDDNAPMGRTGGHFAAPIFAQFIKQGLAGKPAAKFVEPPGLDHQKICSASYLQAGPNCPDDQVYWEVFLPGTAPTEVCPVHNPPPSSSPWDFLNNLFPPGAGVTPPTVQPPATQNITPELNTPILPPVTPPANPLNRGGTPVSPDVNRNEPASATPGRESPAKEGTPTPEMQAEQPIEAVPVNGGSAGKDSEVESPAPDPEEEPVDPDEGPIEEDPDEGELDPPAEEPAGEDPGDGAAPGEGTAPGPDTPAADARDDYDPLTRP
jgi:1A family penicillin-binding protein